uniref:DUF2125 domain-containing protein n=1 Tax=Sandarakinorhabdus rubra TaxID=2672568 RepID=UPI0013DC5550
MTRRWPILLSLLPLVLGLGVYWQLWRGWADTFEATLSGWFPGQTVVATGFPYRLETELANVELAHQGNTSLVLKAGGLRLNRGPWRPELTVLQGQDVALGGTAAGLSARVAAATATASLKLDAGRLDRLSVVLPAATGNFGLGPDFRAEMLELHVRERAGLRDGDPASPRLPPRGQLVVSAAGLSLGQGAPITLAADMTIRGAGRLDDYRRWASAGGSLDAVVTGSDATGELFTLTATIVPLGAGARLAGTISTVCPLAVAAALDGTRAPAEQRLRAPVRL